MKILTISDIPPKDSIRESLKYRGIDMICLLGDLDLFSLSELEFISDIPKIGVYGDKCSGTYFGKLGVQDLHLETFKYMGLLFGGFEGAVGEESRPLIHTQEESTELLSSFLKVDVMISHSPPFGINDDNGKEGFIGLRNYLFKKKPRYLIHACNSPLSEFTAKKIGETEIISIKGEEIIEIR